MPDFGDVLREVMSGSATSGAVFDVDGKAYRIKRIDRTRTPKTPIGVGESVELSVRVLLVPEPEHVPSDPGARCN